MKLYGKNPVIERLKADPRTISKIYIQERHPDQGYIQKKANRWGILVVVVPKSKILKIARNLNTQGVVADIEGFPYVPMEELLVDARKNKDAIVFFDGLNDPQNLGSIIRSLACLGKFSLVLPTHKSVEVTEAVLRVACGGDNYIKIAKVANLSRAIDAAKAAGYWIFGSVVSGGENIMETKLPFPLALVIGSEQKGIRDAVRKNLDKEVSIHMSQPRMSLNAAQATTLLCYEILRQRRRKAGD